MPFAGAVFASEKLMDLSRTLSNVREQVSAAASVSSPRSLQLIIASENAFRARLQQHSAELAKLHGQPWLDQVKRNFNSVVAGRRAAFVSIDNASGSESLAVKYCFWPIAQKGIRKAISKAEKNSFIASGQLI